jgi:hypothetical protein
VEVDFGMEEWEAWVMAEMRVDEEARLAEGWEDCVIADIRADKDGNGVESDVEIANGAVVVTSAVEGDVVIGDSVVMGNGIKGVSVVAGTVPVVKCGI